MKLSEAIRLGAMLSPKAVGGSMNNEGRCALACAADALAIPAYHFYNGGREVPYSALRNRYPILNERVSVEVAFPYNHVVEDDFMSVIFRLNDSFGWTREQIADWVETIELAQEPPVPACDSSGETQGQAVTTAVALCAPK